jgi:hypothetical protein
MTNPQINSQLKNVARPFSILLIVTMALMLSPTLWAQGEHGVLAVVKGVIKIKSAKTGATTRARVNMKVYPLDIIIAGKDARAKIVMSDKNILNISPNTELKISKYENDDESGKKNVLLDVIKGKVRSTVEQKYEGDNRFRVRTPSAVAGVRGTDFLAGFDPRTKASQVITFEGLVEVGKPGPGGTILNPVNVAPGQMVSASATAGPAKPVAVPNSQLQKMNMESQAEPTTERPTAAGQTESQTKKDSNTKSDGDAGANSSENPENGKNSDKEKKAEGNNNGAGAGPGDSKGKSEQSDKSPSGNKDSNATSEPETKKDSVRTPAAAPKDASASGPSGREGPSGPPIGSNNTMLDPKDLGTGSEITRPVDVPMGGPTMDLPPLVGTPNSNLPPIPTICESCNDQIRATGPSQLNIRVIHGP